MPEKKKELVRVEFQYRYKQAKSSRNTGGSKEQGICRLEQKYLDVVSFLDLGLRSSRTHT